MKFERNWCEIKGQRILYVRPKAAVSDIVSDEDWVGFFEVELANYKDNLFLILIDVVGIEEDIRFEGISHIVEILKGRNVCRAYFAILSSNTHYPILARLFEGLAKTKELELKIQLFERRDAAEAWLGRQLADPVPPPLINA